MQNQLRPLSPFCDFFIPDLRFTVYIKILIKITKTLQCGIKMSQKTLNDINNINSFKMGAMVSAHYQRKVTSRFNTEEVEYI